MPPDGCLALTNRAHFLFRQWTAGNCAQRADLPVNTANSLLTAVAVPRFYCGIFSWLNMLIIALHLEGGRPPNIADGGLSRTGAYATQNFPPLFQPPPPLRSVNT